MRRAWKKFWLCASVLAAVVPQGAPLRATQGAGPARAAMRVNELTLARLRPGRSTLENARALYGEKSRQVAPDNAKIWAWADPCAQSRLRLEADKQSVIQTLTASSEDVPGECRSRAAGAFPGASWKTGHGLGLGDSRAKAIELYGPPNSTSPSVRGERELELLFYAFDWAGSDVPQVMEVTCDRASGRVVEITLAFPSL